MPSLWRGGACGWRREVFHCLQLTQIFRNPRSLGTIHLQIPSLVPLEMRKVQVGTYNTPEQAPLQSYGYTANHCGFQR